MNKALYDIAHFLGTLVIYVFLICLSVLISVITASIVNRLLLWGFPSYGC